MVSSRAGWLAIWASLGAGVARAQGDDAVDAVWLVRTPVAQALVPLDGDRGPKEFAANGQRALDVQQRALAARGGTRVSGVLRPGASGSFVSDRYDLRRPRDGKLLTTGLEGVAETLAVGPIRGVELPPGSTLERVGEVALTVEVYELDEHGLPTRKLGESQPMHASAYDLAYAASETASYSATRHGALLRHLHRQALGGRADGDRLLAEVQVRPVRADGTLGEPLGHALPRADLLLGRTPLARLWAFKKGLQQGQGGRHPDLTTEQAQAALEERRGMWEYRRRKAATPPSQQPPPVAERDGPRKGMAQVLGEVGSGS